MSHAQRPVLAGNSKAGCLSLDMLLEAYDPADLLVIAPPPDTTPGWHDSLADHARRRNVSVIEPEKVNEPWVTDALESRGSDFLLSVYYTQLFKPTLLGSIDGLAVNVHPSLLPAHRGTAPLIWALVEGDELTGVSIHELTAGIDEGPLLYRSPLPIHPDDTGYTLHMKATRLVRALVADLVRRVSTNADLPEPVEQTGEASYHSRRDPRVNHVDWALPRARIRNIVRALAPPLPGAYSMLGTDRITFDSVSLADAQGSRGSTGLLDASDPSGRVLAWAADGPLTVDRVIVGDHRLEGSELAEALGPRTGTVLS